jgi:hypothetical protein
LGRHFLWSSAFAQEHYAGVFKSRHDSTVYDFHMSWEDLQAKATAQREKGFELSDIEVGHGQQYAAIWKYQAPRAITAIVPGWDSLVFLKREMAADSFVMQDIEGYTKDGESYFVAYWTKGTDKHKVRKLNSWTGLMNDYEELVKRGYKIVDIEGFTAKDNTTHYLAIYHKRKKNQRTHLFRAADLNTFNIDKRKRNKSGYQLFDFEHFEKRGVKFYFGLYEKSSEGGVLIEYPSLEAFNKEAERLKEEKGLVPAELDMIDIGPAQ